jgi:vacuolar protein sorting-associated protein 8
LLIINPPPFRFIPEETLTAVVTFYKNKNNLQLIQRMLMYLDLKGMDTLHLINLCLEEHLFKALTYICTIVENDYLTPMVKFFKTFKEKMQKNEKFSEYSKYGYRCFWYLKMCLGGKTVTGRRISNDIFENVVVTLSLWLFEYSNIRSLIEFDAKLTYDVMFMFFQGQPAAIVNTKKFDLPLPIKDEEGN